VVVLQKAVCRGGLECTRGWVFGGSWEKGHKTAKPLAKLRLPEISTQEPGAGKKGNKDAESYGVQRSGLKELADRRGRAGGNRGSKSVPYGGSEEGSKGDAESTETKEY